MTTPERTTLAPHQASTLRGARLSKAGQSLPDLWRMLHGNTALIVRFASADTSRGNGSTLRAVATAETGIKQDLTSVPAVDWANLCAAAGWTETGAAALSWCKDVEADVVWAAFAATGCLPVADAAFLRAVRLVRPELLPSGLTLSALFAASQGNYFAVCAAFGARPGTVRIDYGPDQMAAAPPFFLAFLASPQIGALPASTPTERMV
ncbi:MAG: hypothetical protein RLZZ437_3368 [Pseudomonadota bacterium]|jgi:hypothetical protein